MTSTRINAISLYRNILRAHERYLPHEMRQLGDAYVKAEVGTHCAILMVKVLSCTLTHLMPFICTVPAAYKSKT